jgi:hypothetical protein
MYGNSFSYCQTIPTGNSSSFPLTISPFFVPQMNTFYNAQYFCVFLIPNNAYNNATQQDLFSHLENFSCGD